MKHKQISLKLLCSYLFTRLGAQHVSLQTVGSYRLPVYLPVSSQMEAVSQVCGTTRATLACAVVVPLVSHGEEQGYNEQSQTRL